MQSRLQTRSLTVMAAGLGAGARSGLTSLYNTGLTQLTEGLNEMDARVDAFIDSGQMSQVQGALESPVDFFMSALPALFRDENPLEGVEGLDQSSQDINLHIKLS